MSEQNGDAEVIALADPAEDIYLPPEGHSPFSPWPDPDPQEERLL